MRKSVLLLLVVAAVVGTASAALGAAKVPDAERWRDSAPEFGLQATSPGGLNAVRVSGANRYATAAAVSEAVWSYETAFTVFLANGESAADALAIGPSTFSEGPLLLTARDALPPETRAELERLRPCTIVAVGGPAAISDAVLAEADRYTESCSP
jgi:putative cell wall-binding protein